MDLIFSILFLIFGVVLIWSGYLDILAEQNKEDAIRNEWHRRARGHYG
jgi:uncharacterized membrane protein